MAFLLFLHLTLQRWRDSPPHAKTRKNNCFFTLFCINAKKVCFIRNLSALLQYSKT